MAVDKLVDSTQLDTDLTSVANAIRTKGGTSASLAFPAGFVSAIAAIPSGGGSSVLTGTYTPSEDTATFSIDVGQSFTDFAIFEMSTAAIGGTRHLRLGICHFSNSKNFVVTTNNSGSSVALEVNYTTGSFTKSGNTVTYNKSSSKAASGVTYKWFAW